MKNHEVTTFSHKRLTRAEAEAIAATYTNVTFEDDQGKRSHTCAVNGIDGDLKLNRALWVMAEELQQALS